MKIYDFAMVLPAGLVATILKFARVEIDEVGKQEILKNGLYHITPSKEISEKIIESEHLRPATGLIKNLNSYGTASVCLFNGPPDIQNYIKNLVNKSQDNPYVNPTIAVNAIKITPTQKEELANYKARDLVDNIILYEGYCVLPQNKVKAVQLVPDLVRDTETGEPIKNPKTGRYDIKFREAFPEELENDGKSYRAKEDYLQFVEEERKRFGYIKGNNPISNAFNLLTTIAHDGKIESEMTIKNTMSNIPKIIKRKINKMMTPKLDMSADEKIAGIIEEYNHNSKNPYRNKKFGQAVANLQKQGLKQLDLKEELEEVTTGDIGNYFRQKHSQIDKEIITKNGINGISHSNRVAIYSMIIAKNEGILENDIEDKTKDILLSAAYYHDIGRKKGIITDNFGPHAKNSARKVDKMNLTYANGKAYSEQDKKILQAVIEAHEGKEKDMLKICQKYQIDEENIEYVTNLMVVMKDADALDRNRLDLNLPIVMMTDLDTKYLRTNTSKQLLNASYQLESLSKKVSFDKILSYKTNEQQKSKRNEFCEDLKRGVLQTPQIENVNEVNKSKEVNKVKEENER